MQRIYLTDLCDNCFTDRTTGQVGTITRASLLLTYCFFCSIISVVPMMALALLFPRIIGTWVIQSAGLGFAALFAALGYRHWMKLPRKKGGG